MISNLSAEQFRRAATIKDQIDSLQSELDRLLGSSSSTTSGSGRRTMSASARAKIAAAQKARWAKVNGGKAAKSPKTGKRTMSAAARAKIAAAAKARWAKAKAAGKKSLSIDCPNQLIKHSRLSRRLNAHSITSWI